MLQCGKSKYQGGFAITFSGTRAYINAPAVRTFTLQFQLLHAQTHCDGFDETVCSACWIPTTFTPKPKTISLWMCAAPKVFMHRCVGDFVDFCLPLMEEKQNAAWEEIKKVSPKAKRMSYGIYYPYVSVYVGAYSARWYGVVKTGKIIYKQKKSAQPIG